KTLKEAQKIDYKKIIKALGDLPLIKIHCSILAREGLKAAIKDYYDRKRKK
ncbi:MAG: iron-sulfur cluster assembly scaffold protein, partial [Candidatus Nealsonbacteria bacterium]|nr:iron-sulfur cluster assembly scaffold protein [Candidatus Nealsonbacteria bacterium]